MSARVLKSFMENEDLAIIVLSCDRFSSLWPLFFKRYEQYFCYDFANVYLLSNHLDFKQEGKQRVAVRGVGEDVSWSSNLRRMLETINEPNLLLLMDDAPFSSSVELNRFRVIYAQFKSRAMNYINLKASPSPDKSVNDEFGELAPGTGYRAALVPSLWKKTTLLRLLKDDESAWQFEVHGSARSNVFGGFYSINHALFEFDHIVIKGKIDRRVFRKLMHAGEHKGLDFPVMTYSEFVIERIGRIRSKVINCVLPNAIKSQLRRIKYGH